MIKSTLLSSILILLLLVVTNVALAQTATPPENGTGSSASPYEIETLENLYWLSQNPSKWNDHFIQTANIDASETSTWDDGNGGDPEGFSPIGNATTVFSGEYDGQDFTIDGLFIDRSSTDFVGLFGIVNSATIENLGVTNLDITGGDSPGGLAGTTGNSMITNCHTTGTVSGGQQTAGLIGYHFTSTTSNSNSSVTVTGSGDYVGGLAGINYTSTISNSYSTGTVMGSGDYTGGLTGMNFDGGQINDSYSTSNVTGSQDYVGGLLGYNDDSSVSNSYSTGSVNGVARVGGLAGINNNSTISGSHSTGIVTGTGNTVGGLTGRNFVGSSITNSYSTSFVTGVNFVGGLSGDNRTSTISGSYSTGNVNGAQQTGGLVGQNDATVTGGYWNTETSGLSTGIGAGTNAGVTGRTYAEMKQETSFSGWDFIDTWTIDEGDSYPFLQGNIPSFLPGFISFPGGDGSEGDPFQVNRVTLLDSLRYFPDSHFIQTEDIDASETATWDDGDGGDPEGFMPIGSPSAPFTGEYNGQGFTITGLTINRGSMDYLGLFGYAENTTLENIGLRDVDITGEEIVGGLAGNIFSSTLSNNFVSGNISADGLSGGLVGYNLLSTISNSYSSGSVSGGEFEFIGGLIGFNYFSSVSNSYSSSAVSGGDYAGGLVGVNSSSNISNSFSSGSISVTGSFSGGFIGSIEDDGPASVFSGNYWNTETSGFSDGVGSGSGAGITGRTISAMKQQASFTSWDFTNTWSIAEGFTFPYLQGTYHRIGGPEVTGTEGWRFMTSSLDAFSFNDLVDKFWTQGFAGSDAPNEEANVLTWNEATQAFEAIPGIPASGTGFIVYVFDDEDYNGIGDGFPKSLYLQGYEDTSSVSPSLSFTDTGMGTADGWNLVGNPYSQTIDWSAGSGWTKTNLNASIYIWNNAANEYQSWNGDDGTLANEGLIAPFQAFWVQTNAASPELEISLDATTQGGQFYKKELVPSITFTLSDSAQSSSAIVMLNDRAKTGRDPLDAYKLSPLSDDYLSLFSTLKDGTALDINALPADLEESVSVDLDYQLVGAQSAPAEMEMVLNWNLSAFPEDWQLQLTDNRTGEVVDLRKASTLEVEMGGTSKARSAGDRRNEEKEAGDRLPSGQASGMHSQAPESTGELGNENCLPLEGDRNPPADCRGRTVGVPAHAFISPQIIKAKTGQDGGAASRFTLNIIPGSAVSTEPGTELPTEVSLAQNYPNPFNPSTVIRYQLPVNSEVSLKVFDILGREVVTLIDGRVEAGYHQITFNARDLASGMYIYRLVAADEIINKKLTLIK